MQINNVSDLKNITNNHSIFSDVRQKVAENSAAGINAIRPYQTPVSSTPQLSRILENLIREYDDAPLYVQLQIRDLFADSLERMYQEIHSIQGDA